MYLLFDLLSKRWSAGLYWWFLKQAGYQYSSQHLIPFHSHLHTLKKMDLPLATPKWKRGEGQLFVKSILNFHPKTTPIPWLCNYHLMWSPSHIFWPKGNIGNICFSSDQKTLVSSTKQNFSQAALSWPRVPNSDLRKSRIAEDTVFHEQWTDTGFHYCGTPEWWPLLHQQWPWNKFGRICLGAVAWALGCCSAAAKHSKWDFSHVRSTWKQTAKYSIILPHG